jgi:hypothetical protein
MEVNQIAAACYEAGRHRPGVARFEQRSRRLLDRLLTRARSAAIAAGSVAAGTDL